MNLVSGMGNVLIYALLYFFVFEMQRLRNKLSSHNLQDHLVRRRKLVVKVIAVYSLYLVFYMGIFISY